MKEYWWRTKRVKYWREGKGFKDPLTWVPWNHW